MATGHHSLAPQASRGPGRTPNLAEITVPSMEILQYFEPSAATDTYLLYAQGSSIVCAQHGTLAIERRFTRHTDEIRLLAIDNVSEKGAGRLVVSYDAGQTAIVWDCFTGDEIARFASYETITVAAWMRNGNVVFGSLPDTRTQVSTNCDRQLSREYHIV